MMEAIYDHHAMINVCDDDNCQYPLISELFFLKFLIDFHDLNMSVHTQMSVQD